MNLKINSGMGELIVDSMNLVGNVVSMVIGNECYVYLHGKLLHKKYIDHSQSGVTFDVMAYRRQDSMVSYTDSRKKGVRRA